MIAKGKVVKLEYKMFIGGAEGEMIEETREGEPFVFVYKVEEMLPAFEANLDGKSIGEDFNFLIKSDDAYGDYVEERVVEFDKSVFLVDDEIDEEALAEGEMVPMTDDKGVEVDAFVLENKLNSVVLDFNHPLAGEDLYFVGKVLSVEDNDAEEKARLN